MLEFITSAFSCITSGREISEWLYTRLFKNDPEAAEKIAEMQSLLFRLQSSLLDANSKIGELSSELLILKERENHRSKLVRRDAYYEFAEPVDGYGKGPFCLYCTDTLQNLVGIPVSRNGHFSCSKCGSQGWLAGKEEAAIASEPDDNKKRHFYDL